MFDNFHIDRVAQLFRTERAQVVCILLFIVLSAFLTLRYVVVPQREMANENMMVRSQLESSHYASIAITNMLAIAEHENANLAQLSNEWFRIAERLSTFSNGHAQDIASANRIDYKVDLYELRQRLRNKSKELRIPLLPSELGLEDNLDSSDGVRERMMQLRAVEKLADLTLERQIQRLVEIYPLAPVTHVDKQGRRLFEEYPVRVECDIDFDNLFTLFQSVYERDQLFVFRNLRLEAGPTFDAKLRVKAVLSALLFD